METFDAKKFRKKHNCKSCLYYKKMKKCEAVGRCPLENINVKKKEKKTCPFDETGNCPYKNPSGTCFGFCIRKLLQEMKNRDTNTIV